MFLSQFSSVIWEPILSNYFINRWVALDIQFQEFTKGQSPPVKDASIVVYVTENIIIPISAVAEDVVNDGDSNKDVVHVTGVGKISVVGARFYFRPKKNKSRITGRRAFIVTDAYLPEKQERPKLGGLPPPPVLHF